MVRTHLPLNRTEYETKKDMHLAPLIGKRTATTGNILQMLFRLYDIRCGRIIDNLVRVWQWPHSHLKLVVYQYASFCADQSRSPFAHDSSPFNMKRVLVDLRVFSFYHLAVSHALITGHIVSA
jgi:hypothetical protein